MASCADVRVCARSTRFAVKEVDIGIAADVGTLSRLPRVVGSFSWVKDVCMTAREFGPEEAATVGFVSPSQHRHATKADAVAAAVALAALIAGKSPVAVQGTKELLNHARDHTVDDSAFFSFFFSFFFFFFIFFFCPSPVFLFIHPQFQYLSNYFLLTF